jgi:hypothetical protein
MECGLSSRYIGTNIVEECIPHSEPDDDGGSDITEAIILVLVATRITQSSASEELKLKFLIMEHPALKTGIISLKLIVFIRSFKYCT